MTAKKKILLLALVTLTIGLSFGQNPQWVVYDTINTIMPSPNITDITIDGSNNKWIASRLGISKFDNTNWTNYDSTNSGLPTPYVTCLASEGNTVWIGTANKFNSAGSGLVSFDGNTWTIYDTSNTPMLSNVISALSIDNHNNKWVGGISGQILKFDNSNWTVFNNLYLPQWGYGIKDFAFDEDTVWVAQNGIRKFYQSTNWVSITSLNSELPTDNLYAVKKENSIFWIATWGGLAKLDGSDWTVYKKNNSDLPIDAIVSLAVENNGIKWIGSYGHGLVKFDDVTMTIYNTDNSGIPNNYIRAIQIDEYGNKWIGTDKGVAVFNENGVNLNQNPIVKVFPNPFTESVFIEFSNPNHEPCYLSIFNATGQLVEKINDIIGDKIKVDRVNLNSGIYLFQLTNAQGLIGRGKLLIY